MDRRKGSTEAGGMVGVEAGGIVGSRDKNCGRLCPYLVT